MHVAIFLVIVCSAVGAMAGNVDTKPTICRYVKSGILVGPDPNATCSDDKMLCCIKVKVRDEIAKNGKPANGSCQAKSQADYFAAQGYICQ
ncbi:hypothetical protein BCV70DRAFT_215892 [Testicularia cyperi]|uniref:Hydrophobin n=1 Tax=Testicularia cyperi TaxID=1882483 RepID=A0A317XUD6_9BASI|nr:hypothetical protein BCV70DRAFT_215892 [Testicularia cyperi]